MDLPRAAPPAAAVRELRHVAKGSRRLLRQLDNNDGTIGVGQRLLQRATMGWTLAEQAAIAELGIDGWLERQLDYQSIDDSFLEDILSDVFPSLAMSPAQVHATYMDNPFRPVLELILAEMFRAIYSPRQLFERMVVFWSDHFSIDIFSDLGNFLKPTDDREVVRRFALATFPEMLLASAHSPAMLSYLTNDSNLKGHANENYARELMELHTLGVDNGYTETDVKEVARCFTGWTFYRHEDAGEQLGRFAFWAAQHDDGPKTVLGQTLAAGGGVSDAEQVLEILGKSPRTATFISRKMLRYLWGYEPNQRDVKAVARVYRRTGGNVPAMLRKIFTTKRLDNATPKLKRPFHLMVSTVRALGGSVDDVGDLLEYLLVAGHLPFHWEPPNGYPDRIDYWSGFILARWNFAADGIAGRRPAIAVDPDLLNTSRSPRRAIATIDERLLNRTMSSTTRVALKAYLEAEGVSKKSLGEVIGLAVSAPEFQYY